MKIMDNNYKKMISFLKKKLFYLFVLLFACFLIFPFVYNYFNNAIYNSQGVVFDDNSKEYKNTFNKTLKNNGIEITLNAIYSDSTITYVWLNANANFTKLKRNEVKELDYNFLLSYIDNAWIEMDNRKLYLIDYDSNKDNLNINNDIVLNDGNNDDTSVILVFKGGADRTGKISFSVKFCEPNTTFTFNDLDINVPHLVVKDISNQMYRGEFGLASLKKVTYTPTQTIFDIDWIIDSEDALDEFFMDYDTYYINGEKEGYYTSPYPSEYKDDGENWTNQFILNERFDPKEKLEIRLIEVNNNNKMSNYTELFTVE